MNNSIGSFGSIGGSMSGDSLAALSPDPSSSMGLSGRHRTRIQATALDQMFYRLLVEDSPSVDAFYEYAMPIIKSIRDTKHVEAMSLLLRSKEREHKALIEEASKSEYARWAGAIGSFLEEHAEWEAFKAKIRGFSIADMQESRDRVSSSLEAARLHTKTTKNIITLRLNYEAIGMSEQANIHMADQQYFKAIDLMKRIKARHLFALTPETGLVAWLAEQDERIKEVAFELLQGWLATLPSLDLGQRLQSEAQSVQQDALRIYLCDLLDLVQVGDLLRGACLLDRINLAPGKEHYIAVLIQGRGKQAEELLDKPFKISDSDLVLLQDWLGQVLTFLLTTKRLQVLPAFDGVILPSEWIKFTERLYAILVDCLHQCHYGSSLEKLRDFVVCFMNCARALQLDVFPLVDSLSALFYGFVDMTRGEQTKRVKEMILQGDMLAVSQAVPEGLSEYRKRVQGFLPPSVRPFVHVQPMDDLGQLMDGLRQSLVTTIPTQDIARCTNIAAALFQTRSPVRDNHGASEGGAADNLFPDSFVTAINDAVSRRIKELVNATSGSKYSASIVLDLSNLIGKAHPAFQEETRKHALDSITRLILSIPTIDDQVHASIAKDVVGAEGAREFPLLAQIFSLTSKPNIHEILDPSVRQRQYPQMDLNVLCALLRRIKSSNAKKQQQVDDLILLLQSASGGR